MFCNQCGKQILDNSVFCNYCGAKITDVVNNPTYNAEKLLFSLKPEYHNGYVIKKLIPLFIFFSFFFSILITIIRGIMTFASHQLGVISSPFGIINIFLGVFVSFLLVIIIGNSMLKKKYANAEFKFYPDRMEYIDGFFTYNKKQIYYKDVKEISMSQNVFQRNYNIGSIRLTTTGITYHSNHAYSSGIDIYDIKDIEKVYNELKQIIK